MNGMQYERRNNPISQKRKWKKAQPVTSRTALSSVKKMMITTTSNDDFIVQSPNSIRALAFSGFGPYRVTRTLSYRPLHGCTL
jgi:hypothetical protein